MADATEQACRLCLVTPRGVSGNARNLLAAAFEGGDIASLIVTDPSAGGDDIVRQAQARGIAVVWAADDPPPDAVDGVQRPFDAADLKALRTRHPILGIDGVHTRHDAMAAAETGADYLFFGRPDDDDADINAKALELASWWAGVAVVPAVVMGGRSLASVEAAVAAGIEFVALGAAVWDDPRGPAAAVAEANQRLAAPEVAA